MTQFDEFCRRNKIVQGEERKRLLDWLCAKIVDPEMEDTEDLLRVFAEFALAATKPRDLNFPSLQDFSDNLWSYEQTSPLSSRGLFLRAIIPYRDAAEVLKNVAERWRLQSKCHDTDEFSVGEDVWLILDELNREFFSVLSLDAQETIEKESVAEYREARRLYEEISKPKD